MARVPSWALDNGLVDTNPCKKGGRLYSANRADKVWSDAQESAFLAKALKHLRLPCLLAICTAQRQGELLRLLWSAYAGTFGCVRARREQTSPYRSVRRSSARSMRKAARDNATTILVTTLGQEARSEGGEPSCERVSGNSR